MKNKKISVVILSYNQKGYLKESIESVLNQTYQPYEIIVCDDHSTDSSWELIKQYESVSPIVKGLRHEKNIGTPKNRNSGLKKVTGELVTWIDGDDRFKPHKLEKELDLYLKDPDVKWVYSQVDLITEKGKKFHIRYDNPPEGYIFDEVVSMLGKAPKNYLIEYDALTKLGFFDENLSTFEDFDLILKIAKNYKVAYCPEPLVDYRVHSAGIHNSMKNVHIKNLEKVYSKFQTLLEDLPMNKRKHLENQFLYQLNIRKAKKMLTNGNYLKAFKILLRNIKMDPKNVTSYKMVFSLYLPPSLKSFIKRATNRR